MSRPISFLVLASLALLTSGCAGMMMSVEDIAGSDASVVLVQGDSVQVALPTVDPELEERIAKAELTSSQLAKDLQQRLVEALVERGVQASPGDGGESRIGVHVTRFSVGSGAARMLFGAGMGDSSLDGTAVLTTPAGRRELEVTKTGSKGGAAGAGDQTAENIGYFANALAATLVDN